MLASIRSSLVAPLAAPALRSVITQRVPDAVVRGDRNVSAKQLRLRLASVKSIQRITKARPIGLRINNIISQIPPASEEDSKDLKHLVIPISSDRGLCGGVNGAVSKQTKLLFHDLPKDTDIFVIGNKGEALLKRTHQINIKRLVSDCYKNPTSFALASEIAEEIATSAKFDKATMVYNQFKSSIAYNTVAEDIDSGEFMSERLAGFSEKYEFEDEFVETLWMQDMMNFCLATKVYSSLLEAATSECSARMQAMENATKNCGEMITKLTLQMNKARQAMITQELGEIVSGAAAVSEGK